MCGVTPGEATLTQECPRLALPSLYGTMRTTSSPRISAERATHTAIGASGHHRMLGLADLDDGFLGQRRGRASLHAGAAGDAFGTEETFLHAGRDDGVESASGNRQRERALLFFAGAHAARADDALRRIVGEVRIRLVLARIGMLIALVTVAHIAQATAPAMSCNSQSPFAAHVRQSSG